MSNPQTPNEVENLMQGLVNLGLAFAHGKPVDDDIIDQKARLRALIHRESAKERGIGITFTPKQIDLLLLLIGESALKNVAAHTRAQQNRICAKLYWQMAAIKAQGDNNAS